jgi:hypothetical protein
MTYLDKLKEEARINQEYEELLIKRKEIIGDTFMLLIDYGKEYLIKLIEFNKEFLKSKQ